MNKLYFLLLLSIPLFASCGKGYHIKGTSDVSVVDGKMIYLKSGGMDGWTIVDSAEIVHGTFSMKGKVDSVQIVSVFMDGENYMPMVLEEGAIEMKITPVGFQVRGTPLNDKLSTFINEKNDLDDQIEEASRMESQLIINGTDPEEARRRAVKKAREITLKVQEMTKTFIKENYENILGPSVFLMVCESSFPYPLLTPDLQELYEKAPEVFREDPGVKIYVDKAHENMEFLKEAEKHRSKIRVEQADDLP